MRHRAGRGPTLRGTPGGLRIAAVALVAASIAVTAGIAEPTVAVAVETAKGKPGAGEAKKTSMNESANGKAAAAGVRFEAVEFARLPKWAEDDHLAALATFARSCERVLKAVRSGARSGAVAPSPGLLSACADAASLLTGNATRAAAKRFFEEHFRPHRVIHAEGAGLLTGYYEPIIEGSRTPDKTFTAAVLKRPADLINLVAEVERGAKSAQLTHARRTASGWEPFATRQEIEQGALAGQGLELLYLKDPVDLFFMQVQGSGRIALADGASIRVTYDGKNGHPYTSIGRYLIDQGLFPADRMSLQALKDWLRENPQRMREVLWQNKSYVFFRELPAGEGAIGVLEIPLTAGRSLAVDAGHHAIGTPVYVSSPSLTHATGDGAGFHRLMVAQDVGSAIRGPERGDIYFGSGHEAGALAGITKHPGNLFVLLARDTLRDSVIEAEAGAVPGAAGERRRQARQ